MKRKIITLSALFLILAVAVILAYFLHKTKADTITKAAISESLPYLTHYTPHPTEMLAMYERGHAVIPTFGYGNQPVSSYSIKSILRAKQLNLPMDVITGQWEADLYSKDYSYRDIDRDLVANTFTGANTMESANPLNIETTGSFGAFKIDPLGPQSQVDLWREIGRNYASQKNFNFLTQLYPEPPKVLIVANNESSRVSGSSFPWSSKRYNVVYPIDQVEDKLPDSPECPYFATANWCTRLQFRNRVAGDGWMERYGAMFQSWRDNVSHLIWKNARFAAYGGFPDWNFRAYNSANWSGYTSTHTTYESDILPDSNGTVPRLSYYPYTWGGSAPEIYLKDINPDIYLVGPQFGSMNWVFMVKDAKMINPDFHFEISVWDGVDPLSRGITPERYAADIQYSLWIVRPQRIREFKGAEPWEQNLPQFLALTKIIDRVHREPLLTDFWQNGKLVENPVGHHPFQSVTMADGYLDNQIKEKYGIGRWFYLFSNLDEPNRIDQNGDGIKDGFKDFNDKQETNVEIPVFSMAMTKGEAPNREWLVYTYSPKQDRSGVIITVPDFGDITVDSNVAGNFYHLKESDHSVTEIVDTAPILTHMVLDQKDAVIGPASSMQFSVVGKDQYDQNITIDPASISWAATGGNINQNGLFTAGSAKGDFEISVTANGVTEKFPIKVNNLMSEWKFDEGEGLYIADSSGNNNGCFNFNTWDQKGKFGSGGFFDETADNQSLNGAYCEAGDYNRTPKEFTISAWVKQPESGFNNGDIAGSMNEGGTLGYALETAYSENYVPYKTKIGFRGELGSGSFGASVPMEIGKWHHVVAEYKAGEVMRLYFDGQKVKEQTENVPTIIHEGRKEFFLGRVWKGSLDNVRFYNQALSDQEVLDLYNENLASGANIILSKSVDKNTATSGDTLTYSVTYRNGGGDAQNIVISDTIPNNLEVISASGNGTIDGQTVSWNISSIPINGSGTLTVQCKVR